MIVIIPVGADSGPPSAEPPQQVRIGLPYLWGGTRPVPPTPTTSPENTPPNQNTSPNPPPQNVRCGLPFLWRSSLPDCELYLKGECTHGVSGKSGGGCSKAHRKRCPKFMKWGDRSDKGCSDGDCSKLHPLLCDKSLDLKCFAKTCPHKLHTLKCQRRVISKDPNSDRTWPGFQSRSSSSNINSGVNTGSVPPNPWQTQHNHSPSTHLGRAGAPAANSSPAGPPPSSSPGGQNFQHFQKLTVQPQLEAYMYSLRQEMLEEVRVMRTFLAREIQLAQLEGLRPSC